MDMPNLKKYMKKKGMTEDPGETKIPDHTTDPMPRWEPTEVPGHGDIATDDFETVDTDNDPLEDHEGPESMKAGSALDRYQKMKKK